MSVQFLQESRQIPEITRQLYIAYVVYVITILILLAIGFIRDILDKPDQKDFVPSLSPFFAELLKSRYPQIFGEAQANEAPGKLEIQRDSKDAATNTPPWASCDDCEYTNWVTSVFWNDDQENNSRKVIQAHDSLSSQSSTSWNGEKIDSDEFADVASRGTFEYPLVKVDTLESQTEIENVSVSGEEVETDEYADAASWGTFESRLGTDTLESQTDLDTVPVSSSEEPSWDNSSASLNL